MDYTSEELTVDYTWEWLGELVAGTERIAGQETEPRIQEPRIQETSAVESNCMAVEETGQDEPVEPAA